MLPVSIDMFSSSIEHDADDSYFNHSRIQVHSHHFHFTLTLDTETFRLMTITMTKTDDFDYCRLQGD